MDSYARTKKCRINATIEVVDRPDGIDSVLRERLVASYYVSDTLERVVEKMQEIDHEYARQKQTFPGRYVDTWNRQSRLGKYVLGLEIKRDELHYSLCRVWEEESFHAPLKIINGISQRIEIRYEKVK